MVALLVKFRYFEPFVKGKLPGSPRIPFAVNLNPYCLAGLGRHLSAILQSIDDHVRHDHFSSAARNANIRATAFLSQCGRTVVYVIRRLAYSKKSQYSRLARLQFQILGLCCKAFWKKGICFAISLILSAVTCTVLFLLIR